MALSPTSQPTDVVSVVDATEYANVINKSGDIEGLTGDSLFTLSWIVRYCKHVGAWAVFTPDDIVKHYREVGEQSEDGGNQSGRVKGDDVEKGAKAIVEGFGLLKEFEVVVPDKEIEDGLRFDPDAIECLCQIWDVEQLIWDVEQLNQRTS